MSLLDTNSSKTHLRGGLLSVGAVVALGGCQLVFGDFEFRPVDEGGAGGTHGGPCPVNGAYYCDLGQPQICRNGLWANLGSPCASPELCNARGGCDVCLGGTLRCSDDGTSVEICRAGNDGWETSAACANGQFCDPAKLACVACRLGETTCVGPTSAQICRSDQTGFEPRSCNGNPCIVVGNGADYCGECDPQSSPASCSYVPTTKQSFVQRCGADYLWKPTLCENTCVLLSAGNPVCQ